MQQLLCFFMKSPTNNTKCHKSKAHFFHFIYLNVFFYVTYFGPTKHFLIDGVWCARYIYIVCRCNIILFNYYYTKKVLTNSNILFFEKIAICSQNCARIWKGRDQKMVFCRVGHKNVEPTARLFYVKPSKKLFSDWNLSHKRNFFWEHITFYVENMYTFCKQEDCLLH